MTETKIATESGHWYDSKTGQPRYTVIGANKKERPTRITDARAKGYVPSVTTVTKILDKPALGAWLQRQVLMAALTLPSKPEETNDEYIARIMEDSKAQSVAAAARGTAIHGAIERHAQGKTVEPEYFPHVNAVVIELEKISIPLLYGKAEHCFAHPDGYGGKIDSHGDGWVVDFKTKDKIEDGKQLAWDEHAMQIAAYAHGLGIEAARCVNVFVGVTDGKVVCVEHTPPEIARGLRMFKLALALWMEKNNYDPRLSQETVNEKLDRVMGL